MKQITKTFLKGLLAVVPSTLTLYLLYWLAVTAELVLGDIFKLFLPNRWYLPGLGFVAGVFAIFFVGTLLQAKMIHRIFHRLEQRVTRLPVIKSVYIAIHDLVSMFSSDARKDFSQVVLVNMPANGGKQIGFVTRHDFTEFPGALNAENQIAVFVYAIQLSDRRIHGDDSPGQNRSPEYDCGGRTSFRRNGRYHRPRQTTWGPLIPAAEVVRASLNQAPGLAAAQDAVSV